MIRFVAVSGCAVNLLVYVDLTHCHLMLFKMARTYKPAACQAIQSGLHST
jgi:hypothetical protein